MQFVAMPLLLSWAGDPNTMERSLGLPPVEIAKGVVMPALNLGHTDDGSGDTASVELW